MCFFVSLAHNITDYYFSTAMLEILTFMRGVEEESTLVLLSLVHRLELLFCLYLRFCLALFCSRGRKNMNKVCNQVFEILDLADLLHTWLDMLNFFKFMSEQFHHPLPIQGQRIASSLSNAPTEAANCFTLPEIEDATNNFEKKIGSGGFGVVYYGKMKDAKEIAVKVLTSNSFQGKREFTNEVSVTCFCNLTLQLYFQILVPHYGVLLLVCGVHDSCYYGTFLTVV